MNYREHRPPPELASWVECAWELAIAPGEMHLQRVLPDGCMDLLWSEKAGVRVVGPNSTAFLEHIPAGSVIQGVRLHPGCAPPLLGIPASALRDLMVPAREVLGPEAERLDAAAAGAATVHDRTAVLLAEVLRRVRGAAAPDPLVRAVATGLAHAPETPIPVLARELAVSERQLRRRVVENVGYGPKRLARVLRLRRALAAAHAGAPLADAAYGAGYADQAHFTNECRALGGTTPGALLAA